MKHIYKKHEEMRCLTLLYIFNRLLGMMNHVNHERSNSFSNN